MIHNLVFRVFSNHFVYQSFAILDLTECSMWTSERKPVSCANRMQEPKFDCSTFSVALAQFLPEPSTIWPKESIWKISCWLRNLALKSPKIKCQTDWDLGMRIPITYGSTLQLFIWVVILFVVLSSEFSHKEIGNFHLDNICSFNIFFYLRDLYNQGILKVTGTCIKSWLSN